jgi:hypothetical protein
MGGHAPLAPALPQGGKACAAPHAGDTPATPPPAAAINILSRYANNGAALIMAESPGAAEQDGEYRRPNHGGQNRKRNFG